MRSIRLQAFMAGGMLLLLLLPIFVMKNIEQKRRYEARELAQAFALRLTARFNEAAGAVYLLSVSVDRRSGEINRFDELAEELLSEFPLFRALELAPGGVIRRVYPVRGNESIIGHDLLVDKTRNREVHQAYTRRQMTVAGPLTLRQGGIGIIARYPLYQAGTDGRPHFWGLSIGVIDYAGLIQNAGDSEFERRGFDYQICWIPLGESQCKGPTGEPVALDDQAVSLKIGLAQADWRLIVTRREGWVSSFEILFMLLAMLPPAILLGRWVWQTARAPAVIEKNDRSASPAG
ncbi:MAG TPA: CHASE domain-containing protein [Azonexus sp.]|nr:CHASE domain-containing protein [Azonexus sp.]